jgi:hypothetical protein
VSVERTALGVAELLRANVGAEATFEEVDGKSWPGKIVAFPERASAEIAATSPPGAGEPLPVRGNVMLAETATGTRAVAVERIQGVTFKGPCRTGVRTEEFRDLLTLQLAWKTERAATAEVGMVYLQRGLRWIPEYRIDVDGAGRAKVRLQATLVDDLADLDRAVVHLVVGVPKFDFGADLDPMGLAADAAEVAARTDLSSRFANFGSNGIQTQIANTAEYGPADRSGAGLGDSVGGAAANEDLFVFDVKDVSLRRGERMTLAVAEFEIPYADVYTVEAPVTPPPEVWQSGRGADEIEKARQLLRPVAMHKIRLTDESAFPITTAAAVILRDGRLLGQGTTSYTPLCGKCDVAVTQAVGLRVAKAEQESGRTPDAMRWRKESFHRVDLAGSLTLTNDSERAYEVEVTRNVLGAVDTADHGGAVVAVNLAEDAGVASGAAPPAWWGWFNWPWWWRNVNGAGRITWKVKVEPHASVPLGYAWHYFWQ